MRTRPKGNNVLESNGDEKHRDTKTQSHEGAQ
jgi:hypothetical protein